MPRANTDMWKQNEHGSRLFLVAQIVSLCKVAGAIGYSGVWYVCVQTSLGADAHHGAYCNYSIIFATFGQCFCQDGELKAAWNPGYLLHSTQILQSDLDGGKTHMVCSVCKQALYSVYVSLL